jgi:hypothetical protein
MGTAEPNFAGDECIYLVMAHLQPVTEVVKSSESKKWNSLSNALHRKC